MGLKPHEFSELLPLMTASELAALRTDIDEHGQREKIMLYEGKILDGRNRHDACNALKIEPKTTEFRGTRAQALAYVYSKAVHRNLTDSQKACSAVKFLPHYKSLAKDRQKTALPEAVPEAAKGDARDQAGGLFGVSGRYVSDAQKLFDSNPTLFRTVFDGVEVLSRAIRIVRSGEKKKQLRKIAKDLPPVGDCDIRPVRWQDGFETLASASVNLIFEDGPYNIGLDYGRGEKADAMKPELFVSLAGDRFLEASRVMTPDGTLVVMINDDYAAEYCIALKRIGFTIRRWIKWYETFGMNCSDNFNKTSRHIFYCVKDPKRFTFHREAFNRPSDRQTKYNDKRAVAGGKNWDDVWMIPRLPENAKERLADYPTQLPLALVEPIVLGLSNPGDVVCDPFTGSGTTAESACVNGRKFIGFEEIAANAKAADARVRAAVASRKS